MSSEEGILQFNRGVPATETLPVRGAGDALTAALEKDGQGLLAYGDSRGYLPLRETLAADRDGVSSDEVLLGNGSLQLLDMIASLYLGEGKVVAVEEPTYDRAITIFKRAGTKVVGVELESDGVKTEKLREVFSELQPELFYTIPDFQNPTGTTTSREKRERVAALLDRYGVTAVEDSPYRRLRYRGEPEPELRSLNQERVLQISSFSKLVGPGVRVGWMVGDSDTIDELSAYAEDTYISPVALGQGIVHEFMVNGWLEENVEKLKSLYRPRLEATLENLEKYFPEAEWVEAKGGFFVGVWLPDRELGRRFYEEAGSRGLVLTSPEGFFPDNGGENFLRLPFPALTPPEIESGIKRIAEVWNDL